MQPQENKGSKSIWTGGIKPKTKENAWIDQKGTGDRVVSNPNSWYVVIFKDSTELLN